MQRGPRPILSEGLVPQPVGNVQGMSLKQPRRIFTTVSASWQLQHPMHTRPAADQRKRPAVRNDQRAIDAGPEIQDANTVQRLKRHNRQYSKA